MCAARRDASVSAAERRRFENERDGSTLQLLFKAARLANEQAVARVHADPRAARLRPAHTALLPHLSFDGVRLTDLATRTGTSKQAVGQLVDDLDAMGLIERIDDPGDGRAKRIRFSRQGHSALMHGLRVLGQLEEILAEKVGRQRMRELHETLLRITRALEDDPGSPPPATV
jgi:DNA-binding MarR family transcriptional regulator